MSDKKRNNIDHADQNLLEQMVTEALMRDKMETPDVDMEWKTCRSYDCTFCRSKNYFPK